MCGRADGHARPHAPEAGRAEILIGVTLSQTALIMFDATSAVGCCQMHGSSPPLGVVPLSSGELI